MEPFCPGKMPNTGFYLKGYPGDPEMVTASVTRLGFSSKSCWANWAMLEKLSLSDGKLLLEYSSQTSVTYSRARDSAKVLL